MKYTKRFLIILLLSTLIYSQEDDMTESLKQSQPGPQHELLKRFTGDWTLKYTTESAGAKMDGTGTGSGKMMLGGRFLFLDGTLEVKSEAIEFEMKAASIHIFGYDKRINKYTFYGIDEMGTYSVTAEGEFDHTTKHLVLLGKVMDPTGSSQDLKDFKLVYDLSKDNEIKLQMFSTEADKSEKLFMEVMMTKK